MAGVEQMSAGNIPPRVAVPGADLLSQAARSARVRNRVVSHGQALQRELGELGAEQIRALEKAVEDLNAVAVNLRKNIRYQVFEKTGDLFAQVVNAETGEVIKTVPPIELLETLARISEAVGLLIDEMG